MIDTAQKNKPVTEEVSLWELIFAVREKCKFLLKRWPLILLVGIIGAGIGLLYGYTRKPQYAANLTFVMDDSKSGGGLGSYAGIASQLGINLNLGEGGVSGVFNGDNIMEFLKSRLMIEQALLTDTIVGGKRTTLADLYLEENGYKARWAKHPLLSGLSFPPDTKAENLSLIQDSVMTLMYDVISKRDLMVEKPDNKLTFIKITTTSNNQYFAKYFTEKLVHSAIGFYILTKTQQGRANVNNLQLQADSLEGLLNKRTYDLAAHQDLNLNTARKVAEIGEEIGTRDKMLLSTLYGEVIKNLGMAKMELIQETPIMQVVDTPILPLRNVRVGKLICMILGSFICVLVFSVYLLSRDAFNAKFREKMNPS